MNNNVNLTEAFNSIRKTTSRFPEEQIQTIIDIGLEGESDLLEILEQTIEQAKNDEISSGDWRAFIIAAYILAKLRSKTGYKYFIEACKLPTDQLEQLLGDTLTESLHLWLGSTFTGDFEALHKIIFNDKLNVFARDAALRCYLVLLKAEFITREEVISVFKNILLNIKQDDSEFRGLFICSCINIYAEELREEIQLSFKNNLVDESIIDLSSVETEFKQERSVILNEFMTDFDNRLIDDPLKELSKWSGWIEREPEYIPDELESDYLETGFPSRFQPQYSMMKTDLMQKK